jgi:hypothetical protein
MITHLLLAAASLIGLDYSATLKGTALDPARRSTGVAREVFVSTLNGPQKPGVEVEIRGRKLVVFETCMANFCPFSHSVIAIDPETHALYAASFTDEGKQVVVGNPEIEQLIGRACDEVECDFEKVIATAQPVRGETLPDSAAADEGASCTAVRASDGGKLLVTSGNALMRWKGVMRRLREPGIGGPTLYSEDQGSPIVVTLKPRPGAVKMLEEGSVRPMTLSVLDNNAVTSVDVLLRCEA